MQVHPTSSQQPRNRAGTAGSERGTLCGRLGQALRSGTYVDFREGQLTLVNLVHRFRNNCIIHLSTNPIAQFKKPQRSPLRLRFFNCTLESVSCANDTVIYETMY